MRRRPRPFMLSASTGDGAALVVIVGLLCLPLSAFVALPAMLLTAKLVDSNINWFVLVLIVLPVIAASACFIATPILAIVSFAALIAALYFVRQWLKRLPETSQIRGEFKRFRKIAIYATVVCYIGFLIVLLLENYTAIMTIMTCATLILLFVVVGLFSFVMFLMFDANNAAKTCEENQSKISNSKENDKLLIHEYCAGICRRFSYFGGTICRSSKIRLI